MTTSSFSSSRGRRIAVVASALMVIALPAVLFALVVGAGVPDSWWPRTGQAFSADAHSGSAPRDPCDLIVGPGKTYCEHGPSSTTTTSSSDETPHDGASTAWLVIPPATGLVAVVVRRRRAAAGHGRH